MKLRDADARELLASTSLTSVTVGLLQSVERSDIACWIYLNDKDRIVAVSGATHTVIPEFALVWAMGTDEVLKHWDEVEPLFILHVNNILDIPGIVLMGNVIDLRNTVHIKWVKKLGFNFTGDICNLGGYKFESFIKGKY